MVDPLRCGHGRLHLHLGHGRRQCRLYRCRKGRHGGPALMDLSAFSLSGRTVMVTGANTGIGQGIALSVGRAGGKVIGVGRSSMEETASLMAGQGADFAEVRADLSSTSAAQAMFDQAWAEHGVI